MMRDWRCSNYKVNEKRLIYETKYGCFYRASMDPSTAILQGSIRATITFRLMPKIDYILSYCSRTWLFTDDLIEL